MYCRNCGNEVAERQEICLKCGVRPMNSNKFCQNCGKETAANQEICIGCGVRVKNAMTNGAMTKRGPIVVFLLTLITCGFYGFYWYVATKIEMNKCGADVPTAWLLIIPFVSFYWFWKFSEGVATVTKGGTSAGSAFFMMFCLGPIGMAIVQSGLNSSNI